MPRLSLNMVDLTPCELMTVHRVRLRGGGGGGRRGSMMEPPLNHPSLPFFFSLSLSLSSLSPCPRLPHRLPRLAGAAPAPVVVAAAAATAADR